MKERPVIFNGEMVRAILDGRKTRTRRVMKHQPRQHDHQNYDTAPWSDAPPAYYNVNSADWACKYCGEGIGFDGRSVYRCPFGRVGDRLWVRETWQGPLVDEEHLDDYRANADKFQTPEFCEYAADGGARPEFCDLDDNVRQGWRPSIHMPRWASRITLEITGVLVERLNDISDGDAIREGCSAAEMKSGDCVADVFARLWASIYGVENWRANPWVWVIEFRRLEVRDASK
ncbi:hypothetical protein SME20J_14730 [Serratia marcescens]|nr:hypothetical protein SME20J_14730 [Serratia marcescens]